MRTTVNFQRSEGQAPVAEMQYQHWGLDPVNLLIVSDRTSGRVITHLWSLWFTSSTPSFHAVLDTRGWTDRDELRGCAKALANLVAYCMNGRVGKEGFEPAKPGVFLSSDRFTFELFDRHDRLWRVMNVYHTVGQGVIAPHTITFEQTDSSGGATFANMSVAPNNPLKLTARGRSVAEWWLRSRAAA